MEGQEEAGAVSKQTHQLKDYNYNLTQMAFLRTILLELYLKKRDGG